MTDAHEAIRAWMASRGPLLQQLDDRAAWEAARETGHRVGGSTVPTLMGVGFESPWTLWWRASGRDWPGPDKSALFSEGHAWEPVILDLYAAATGATVHPLTDTLAIDPVDPWAVGSFDGLVCDPETVVNHGQPWSTKLGGVDAKTDRTGEHVLGSGVIEVGDDSSTLLAPVYLCQMQHYLSISGLPWWDVAAVCLPAPVITDGALLLTLAARLPEHPPELTDLVARLRRRAASSLRIVRVMRDEQAQDVLRRAVRDRRQRWLIDLEEPPIDDSAAARHAQARPGLPAVRRATAAQVDAAVDLVWRRRQLEALEADYRTAQTRFMADMGARKIVGDSWSAVHTTNHQLRIRGL
jgi:hypothetical protein